MRLRPIPNALAVLMRYCNGQTQPWLAVIACSSCAPSHLMPSLAQLAEKFAGVMDSHDARWLLNGSADDALAVGADGVHLDSRRLAAIDSRPLPEDLLAAASCHNRKGLVGAGRAGLDFVALSPVRPTASHPCATSLGWRGLEDLCRQSPLPVYALGGMQPDDIEAASRHGAYGVAGIRAFGGNV